MQRVERHPDDPGDSPRRIDALIQDYQDVDPDLVAEGVLHDLLDSLPRLSSNRLDHGPLLLVAVYPGSTQWASENKNLTAINEADTIHGTQPVHESVKTT